MTNILYVDRFLLSKLFLKHVLSSLLLREYDVSTTEFWRKAGNKSLMLIMDQIDPPRQTANIFVLFHAFEMLCFPDCITDMSQEYLSSINVRRSFFFRSGWVLWEWMCAKQTIIMSQIYILLKYLLLDIKCAFCRILNQHISVFLW